MHLLVHTVEWTADNADNSGRASHHFLVRAGFSTVEEVYDYSAALLEKKARQDAEKQASFGDFDPEKITIHPVLFSLTPNQL